MRILEIILKLAFLGISLFMLTMGLSHESFTAFLIVSVLLGLVLIFNQKHPSWKYPANWPRYNRVIRLRRIEGGLILVFALVSYYIAFIK